MPRVSAWLPAWNRRRSTALETPSRVVPPRTANGSCPSVATSRSHFLRNEITLATMTVLFACTCSIEIRAALQALSNATLRKVRKRSANVLHANSPGIVLARQEQTIDKALRRKVHTQKMGGSPSPTKDYLKKVFYVIARFL